MVNDGDDSMRLDRYDRMMVMVVIVMVMVMMVDMVPSGWVGEADNVVFLETRKPVPDEARTRPIPSSSCFS